MDGARAAAALLALLLAAVAPVVALAQPSEGSEYTYNLKVRITADSDEGRAVVECEGTVVARVERVTEDEVVFRVSMGEGGVECKTVEGSGELADRVKSEIEDLSGLEVPEGTVGYPIDSEPPSAGSGDAIKLYVDPGKLGGDRRVGDTGSLSLFGVTISYSIDASYDGDGVLERGEYTVRLESPDSMAEYVVVLERGGFHVPFYAVVIAVAVVLAAFSWLKLRPGAS